MPNGRYEFLLTINKHWSTDMGQCFVHQSLEYHTAVAKSMRIFFADFFFLLLGVNFFFYEASQNLLDYQSSCCIRAALYNKGRNLEAKALSSFAGSWSRDPFRVASLRMGFA